MNSDNNKLDNEIANTQSATDAKAKTVPNGDQVAELHAQMEKVILYINEREGADKLLNEARELQGQLRQYIKDRRKESEAILKYRFWVTLLVSAMSISLWGLLIYCFVAQPPWLAELGGEYRVPFMLALGGGAVFLASILVRGVYRVRSDVHADDQIPEHLKQLHDMVKDARQ